MINPPAKICFGTKLKLSVSTSPRVGIRATTTSMVELKAYPQQGSSNLRDST